MFQEPRLLPWLSVADNVGFGLAERAAGGARGARRARAATRSDLPSTQSAGRAISRAASSSASPSRALRRRNPKVLLLDEPFSALDAFTRASLHDHLLGLWDETRPTVLMVTHDVHEAVTLADRAIVMQPKPGRIFDELPLAIARPRDAHRLPFESAVRRVMSALDHSLNTVQTSPQRERDREAAGLWW